MDHASVNTHTLYYHHVRELKKAKEAIQQTNKYLQPESEHYLPAYIEKLKALHNQGQNLADKIKTMQGYLESYTLRAQNAQHILDSLPANLEALANNNEIFLTPPNQRHECLYILDEGTCHASCMGWENDEEIGEAIVLFSGKQDIELHQAEQTDAIRVWHHNVILSNLCITDHRSYQDAHRDAIQLIPPALHKKVDGKLRRLGDQLSGTIMDNVSIRNCKVHAPNGPLQGIFASDGMHRNLRIIDNEITTAGSHSISIAGLLTGGVISGNRLCQLAGYEVPTIRLYPARVGGNMAEDGVLTILSFAKEVGYPVIDYEAVEQQNNICLSAEGEEFELEVSDLRRVIPQRIESMSLGLNNFRYHAYLNDFSSLTYADYAIKDPVGAEQLKLWLELRYDEYLNGRAVGHVLGQPTTEQQNIAKNNLAPALEALQQGSIENTYISEISHTAIRSFIMKRIAMLHADIAPLRDLGEKNSQRDMTLCFLLKR